MSPLQQELVEVPPDDSVSPVELDEVVHGKYRIGRTIGFGGMATVVAGHHLELDQPIAIKFLHRSEAAKPDAVRRFLSEARAAARLSSPHVARVLDVGSAPTARGGIVPFMVMELLEGLDLDALVMTRGRLPLGEAIEYVMQACEGVSEAHAMGIIHRDLKPGNLFLTRKRDGTPLVKLLDFGISKTVTREGRRATSITSDREMMGSPRYMSPEQVRSAKDVDARTDVWSLGVILHELLSGAPPFEAENVADTLVAILHAPPRSIAKAAPDVPPALIEIVMRCLQKKPEGRYASVDEFAAALAPYRSVTPIVLPPMASRIDEMQGPEAGVSVRTIHRSRPKSRMLITSMLAFAAVGLALVTVAVVMRLRATPGLESAASAAQGVSTQGGSPPSADAVPAAMPSSTTEAASSSAPSAAIELLPTNVPPDTTKRPSRPAAANRPPLPPAPRPTSSSSRSRTSW